MPGKNKKKRPEETQRILANKYLVKKLEQARKDMIAGKGVKIPLEDTWK